MTSQFKGFLKTGMMLAALAVTLSGCASLLVGGGSAPSRYTLAPVTYAASEQDMLNIRLVIADPNSEAAFATSKIAHSPAPLRYDYYTGGEWTDRAPRLFGIFLARSFENRGRVQAVGDRTTLPIGDYILDTDIRSFHIESRAGQNVAVISYYARLSNRRSKTIASELFSASEPFSGNSVEGAVEAFNAAANRAGDETVSWTLENIIDAVQSG